MIYVRSLLFAAPICLLAATLCAREGEVKSKQLAIRGRILECIDDSRGGEKTKVVSEPSITTLEGRSAWYMLGGEVPVADGRGVRFLEFGKKFETRAKFTDSGRIQLEVTLFDIKLIGEPGETPRTSTTSRKETIEVAPGEVAKFMMGKDHRDAKITIRLELSVAEAPAE